MKVVLQPPWKRLMYWLPTNVCAIQLFTTFCFSVFSLQSDFSESKQTWVECPPFKVKHNSITGPNHGNIYHIIFLTVLKESKSPKKRKHLYRLCDLQKIYTVQRAWITSNIVIEKERLKFNKMFNSKRKMPFVTVAFPFCPNRWKQSRKLFV